MKKIFKILTLILIIVLLVACKKTEPVVSDGTEPETEVTPEPSVEDVGVIQQITEDSSDEESPEEDEEPEKPDENIENVTEVATIIMDDLKFDPKELNVTVGTVVVWKHQDEYGGNEFIKHVLTIYPPSGPGTASKPMFMGEEFNLTVTQIGRYRYISVPYSNRMQAYINVR